METIDYPIFHWNILVELGFAPPPPKELIGAYTSTGGPGTPLTYLIKRHDLLAYACLQHCSRAT